MRGSAPAVLRCIFLLASAFPAAARRTAPVAGPSRRIRAGRHRLRLAPVRRAMHDLPWRERRRRRRRRSPQRQVPQRGHRSGSRARHHHRHSRAPACRRSSRSRPRSPGIIAYLRNMNSFDRGSVKAGDAGRGRAVVEGKGGCARCHRVGAQGSRVAPDLSDIGAMRSAGIAAAVADRSDEPDDADQSPGARRHEATARSSTAAG